MSATAAGWLRAGLLVLALALVYRPLGEYMARVFTTHRRWRVERGMYRLIGVDAEADQRWSTYLRSLLAFSAVSVLLLYGFQRIQTHLMLPWGFPG